MALLSALVAPALVVLALKHPPRERISRTPADLGLGHEPIEFRSAAGDVTLRGWFLPARGGASGGGVTVVVSHGYSTNRLQKGTALEVGRALVGRGYHVLLFDYRGHGESGGRGVTIGDRERDDLAAAIEYARSRAPRVALLGYSMGAATALLVAARVTHVEAVIADSPFCDLRAYLTANLSYWTRLPRFITPYILWLNRWLYGIRLDDVSPERVITRIAPRPVLFIHGRADPAIPYGESERLFTLAQGACPVNELFLVDEAVHVGSYDVAPEAYVERVVGFLDRHVRGRPAVTVGTGRT